MQVGLIEAQKMNGSDIWSGGRSGGSLASFNIVEPVNNISFTCVEESIRDPVVLPYSNAFITAMTSLRAIFWLALLPSGLILNTTVITLFAKYKKL